MRHTVLAALVASIALGLSANVRAQEAWLWQNPKPTLMDFNSVHFPAAQTTTGWAVGNAGTIFRTGNGGTTWSQISALTTSANLESVWFSILNSGWAVGAGGTILKATSLGNTWTPQTSGVTHDLKSVHALNSNSGWAVGYSGTTGVILKTTNGGTTWTSQTYSQARFTSVRIVDTFVGYAVGLGGVVYKTADGGSTWFALTSGTTADLRGLHFRSPDTGFVVGAGGLIRYTSDGGFSWTTRTSGTTRTLTSIHFSTASKGWVAGDSGLVLRTTNGGTSWTASTNGTPQLRAVQGIGDTVFSVGVTGRILRSYNAGVTWTALSSGVVQTVNTMSFPTATTGYAAGPGGGLLKSTDYGANWSAVTMAGSGLAGLNVTALHFPSANVGYAVGAGGVMMKTVDGGVNWAPVTTGVTNNLSAVYFQTVDRGFIAGANGLVRRTVDGGASWTTPTVPTTSQNFMAIAFATPAIGWVAGGTAVRKTIDSGKTWTTQNTTSGGSLSGIVGLAVLDTLNAFVIRSGGVHRTKNGGSQWTSLSISGNGTFRAGAFVSPAQGYIVNGTGSIGVTSDSGVTWTFQSLLPTTHSLNTVLSAPGGHLFTAGTDGAIMKLRPAAPSGFAYSGSPFVFGNGVSITPIKPVYSGVVSLFTVTPALPAGLILDSTSGTISGTATAAQATTTHSIVASNEAAQAVTSISITVRNQITSIQYPSSQVTLGRGTAMTPLTPTVVGVAPFGPYNCTSNPPLPSGLTLEALTCVISGTPANAQAAVNYIITASNGFAPFNKADTLRITVAAPPSNLTYSTPQASYTVGQAITPNTATVTVVTGTSLRYSIAPALPTGLFLDSLTGTISGTPTKTTAATAYTVTVTSSVGSTTGLVNITVNGPPANVTYPAVVFGVGVLDTGRGTPTAVGPVTTWSITPAPPAGLTMDTVTGKFSGRASEAISGSAHTVTARNQYGSSSVAMTISVLNPIVLFNYSTKSFVLVAGSPMTSVSPIVAGTIPFTPVTYSVSPALPAGINLNANTGAISGTPTTASQLSTKHTVTARNGVPSFNKTDTLTFLVQTTAIRLGRTGGLSPALLLDGRMVALAPPEGTKNLRVTLRDMSGRVLLDRSVEWTGMAHLDGVRKSAAGSNGIMALRVQFVDENGRSLGRTEQRIPLLTE